MSERQQIVGVEDLRVATGAILDGVDPASDGLVRILATIGRQEESGPLTAAASSGRGSALRVLPGKEEDEEDWDEDDDEDDDDEDDEDLEEDEDQEDWEYDWEEGDEDDEGEGGDDEEEF